MRLDIEQAQFENGKQSHGPRNNQHIGFDRLRSSQLLFG